MPVRPLSPIPDPSPASRYTGRWRCRRTLTFRVWPKFKTALKAACSETRIAVNGMRLNEFGAMELHHNFGHRTTWVFEMERGDEEILAAVAAADARFLKLKPMTIRTPGTRDEGVKKECWLDVPVLVYPDAPTGPWKDGEAKGAPGLVNLVAASPEEGLRARGVAFSKIVLVDAHEEFDGDLLVDEVIRNDAVIVFTGTSKRSREFYGRSRYWTFPARKPLEEGGLLRGYQFYDRVFRWVRKGDPAAFRSGPHFAKMHEVSREKGRASRRSYFVDETVNRFAERVGMSRQRVASRFLDEGVVDWLLRSVDQIPPLVGRDAQSLLRGRVRDAVDALEFYYRAAEAVRNERLPVAAGAGG